MASRKGIEPLTPGLGNLCSILLSYRDSHNGRATRYNVALPSLHAIMIFRRAHLLCLLALAVTPAQSCGPVVESALVQSVAPGGEIVFEGGERARFGGLKLAPSAEGWLRALTGKRVGVAPLAGAPDRWGRRLVDLVDPDGESVSSALLVGGLAEVRAEPETRACEAERLDKEAAARAAGEGIWGEAGAILAAVDTAALRAADGRFVVVSGIVRRVGEGRAKVYLDFASRGGFSFLVARKSAPAFRRAGVDLKTLVGRKVIVRGVLDVRFGPRIEIADPSMIEPEESVKETSRGG